MDRSRPLQAITCINSRTHNHTLDVSIRDILNKHLKVLLDQPLGKWQDAREEKDDENIRQDNQALPQRDQR